MERAVFPRVVSAKAPSSRIFASAWFEVQLVGEVFGPPDVRGTVATWSFADASRKVRFAIIAKASGGFKSTKPMEMDFVGDRAFFDWATERINLTHNGDLPPAFLMAAR